MSRRMIAPGVWETEDGRKPYTGPRSQIGGGLVVGILGKPPVLGIPTNAARERERREAYNRRQRELAKAKAK